MSHGSRVSALGLVGWLRQWCFFLEQSLFVLTIDEPAAFAFSPCLVAEVCKGDRQRERWVKVGASRVGCELLMY